jgi:hypothetical protein
MADVIDLSGRRAVPTCDDGTDEPHLAGPAFCGACHHEWSAVAPHGVTHLECPKCKRYWGALKHAVEPDQTWRCNCGEELFWLTPTGAMCRRCGVRSNDWADA